MIRETFTVGTFQCNCTILGDPISKQALIVDPGGDSEQILKKVADHELRVIGLIHTHAHFDHFMASGEINKQTGAPIYLHLADKPLWDNLELQCQLFQIPYTPVPQPDYWLSDDMALPGTWGGVTLHTPGHTPGSLCFLFETANILFSGDTLFHRGIGRTDLWGGDSKALENSVKKRLYPLNESLLVIPGHGSFTTIGDEIRENAYIRG